MKLPPGATSVTPAAIVIAQVAVAAGESAPDPLATSSEPELIRKEKASEAGA